MSDRKFWHAYSDKKRRPIDELVNHSPSQTADLMRGTLVIFDAANNLDPDLVIFPYRGSAPIAWSLDAWANCFGRERFTGLNIPIGTTTEYQSGVFEGPGPGEKWKIIARELEVFSKISGVEEVKKPLLIDEVHSGGTLSQAAMVLDKVLRANFGSSGLDVIAAQDNRPQVIARKKNAKFIEMATNVYSPTIRTQTVLMPLVYVDCVDLLPTILRPDTSAISGARVRDLPAGLSELMNRDISISQAPSPYDYLTIMHNPEAEQLFKKLVGWTYRPQRLEALMPLIRKGEEIKQSELVEGTNLADDYEFMLEALTHPNDDPKVVNPQAIRDWIIGFYSEIKARRIF